MGGEVNWYTVVAYREGIDDYCSSAVEFWYARGVTAFEAAHRALEMYGAHSDFEVAGVFEGRCPNLATCTQRWNGEMDDWIPSAIRNVPEE